MTGSVNKKVLQRKEEGNVEFTVDTSRFIGSKTVASFLTIEFGVGFEEFKFWITANSIEDEE